MAATMQGIQKGPGTLPVSPKKADSTTAHTMVMATVALRENRATSPGVNSSTARHSARAVYSRGMSGSAVMNPHLRCSRSVPQERPYAWGG